MESDTPAGTDCSGSLRQQGPRARVQAVSGIGHAEAIDARRRWEGGRLIARRRPMDRKDFNNALAVPGFAGGVVALAALITVMLTLS